MTGQQICLKWNSFQSNIVTSFESLWEEEGLVDVTLASDGQCIRAHKVILSACSPFFRQVFQANPCQHPVIILQDVHFSELESLLCFVYKGEVNIEQDNLPALLRAAETLQIRGLSGASERVKEKMEVAKKSSSTETPVEGSPAAKRSKVMQPPRSPTPPRRVSSSAEAWCPQGGGGEDTELPTKEEPKEPESRSPSPLLSLGDALEDSTDASLDLATAQDSADTGQIKRFSKSDAPTFHADPSYDSSQASKSFPFPPFPCPFCDRAYTSWGFRRRHIKAVHTQSPRLSCKWCALVLPSHGDWEQHVTAEHNLSPSDAHNGLLILEEAHMVLQIPHPTRLDTFVSMIRKSGGETAVTPGGGGTETPRTSS